MCCEVGSDPDSGSPQCVCSFRSHGRWDRLGSGEEKAGRGEGGSDCLGGTSGSVSAEDTQDRAVCFSRDIRLQRGAVRPGAGPGASTLLSLVTALETSPLTWA